MSGRGQSPPSALQALLDELLASGEVSAVIAGVSQGDRTVTAVAGALDPDDRPASAERSGLGSKTRFDLASLTKLYTATLALQLDREGALPLDRPLGSLVPGLPPPVRPRPVEALLRHRAGLIPWYPFYVEAEAGGMTSERFLDAALWHNTQEAEAYSDLGPILWSLLAAESGHATGEALARLQSAPPTYSPDPASTAAVRLSNRREVELAAALGISVEDRTATFRGVPQDGNARALLEPGHAGLFGSLDTVLELGGKWLDPQAWGSWTGRALEGRGRYALGWWRADSELDGLPQSAFGHNGFTGCSLWLEPERGRVIALLGHRTTLSDTLDRARREFHRLALTLPL